MYGKVVQREPGNIDLDLGREVNVIHRQYVGHAVFLCSWRFGGKCWM